MARKSNTYWEKRSTELMLELEKQTKPTIDTLIQIYEQATKNINKEIAKIFNKYANDGKLTKKEALEMLTTKETKQFYERILEEINTIDDEEIKRKLLAKYNAPAYAYRISRYEALQQNIDIELKKLANLEQTITEYRYIDTIKEGYYHNIYDIQKGTGIGFNFLQIDMRTINLMLNENWIDNANFSKRIWNNSEKLSNYLRIQLTADTMSGKSIHKIASELSECMNVGLYNATRLVRTEVNHFVNEAEMLSYEECGIEKYRFIATLDNVTCEHCAELDNRVFYVKDRQAGKNYPPIHANDRCTTVAEFDDNVIEGLTRRARDENGKPILVPKDMNYKEWSKEYKPKLILEQGINNSKKQLMRWQEQHEELKSAKIKPSIHSNNIKSYRVNKYQDKIMELYKNNGNENMCILNSTTGELIGNITDGKNRTTVGLDTKTMLRMLTKSKNSIIMIHNHPENYSFSLTDIKAFNKFKQIDSMILLTDNYKFYLKNNNIKLDNTYIEQTYKQIEKQIKKDYNVLNGVEKRDLINQRFFKKVGWIYEKEKN